MATRSQRWRRAAKIPARRIHSFTAMRDSRATSTSRMNARWRGSSRRSKTNKEFLHVLGHCPDLQDCDRVNGEHAHHGTDDPKLKYFLCLPYFFGNSPPLTF